MEGDVDSSQLISMSEAGTRVALIDRGPVVRVYSLADHKPFLTRLERDFVAVAPDASWIAVARPPAPDEPAAVVDVIPILAWKSDFPSRTRIPMEGPSTKIEQLYAAQSSVVAVLQTEEVRAGGTQQATTTVVFDATTGKPRFGPLEGQAEVLGAARELLLTGQSPWVVKTSDGSALAPWGELPAADGPPVFRVSPGKEALAVVRAQAGNAKEANAIVYFVRGDGLVLAGQVVGLPAELLVDPSPLDLADDARSITETRSGEEPGKFVWPVTIGREAASARQARAVETTVVSASPSGQFEMREESEAGAGDRTSTVVRCADGSTLKKFKGATPDHRFSSDDRWLATWDDKGVKVFDLGRCETAWELNLGSVTSVDFEAGNAILNVQLSDGATLIPLDQKLMERFAKWLVPRRLTFDELCQYGLKSEEECRKGVVAPRG